MRCAWLGRLMKRALREAGESEPCLLAGLSAHLCSLDSASRRESPDAEQLQRAVEGALVRGYTLRSHWPHVPEGVHEEWLGVRFVLGHTRWFSANARCTSIVSSRLGRYGRLLADWPALLELLLQSVRRSGAIYLAVPDTTVAPLVEPLLARSAVPCLRVELPTCAEDNFAAWLVNRLQFLANDCASSELGKLYLSPELAHDLADGAPIDQPLKPDNSVIGPLQDRVAIGCAATVKALLVRPRGTIAQLLERRLGDRRFGEGTVSVFLPRAGNAGSTGNRRATAREHASQSTQLEWLEHGAVGWYVAPGGPRLTEFGCRPRRAQPALWQLSCRYSLCAHARVCQDQQRPRELVHCVRGTPGMLGAEAAHDFIAQAWLRGHMLDESPLATLISILNDGRLRGRAVLNRTGQPCVSFSGVPLRELLARRTFQPHLGRWDWEPFGLLIDRHALERLGARPVIYGDAETYRQLTTGERLFFQPAKRRASSQHSDWVEEREWRVPGDVRFNDLPRSAVRIFVAYEHQARSLACQSSWPVIWLQDVQTHARPVGSEHRPHKEVRTGRS